MVAHTHPDALPSPSARGEGGRRAGRSMSAGGGALGYLGGAHPTVNLMHVATKVAPALVYLLCASGDRDGRAARCASDVRRGARARAAGRGRALPGARAGRIDTGRGDDRAHASPSPPGS